MTTLAILALLWAQAAPAADAEVRAVSVTVTDDKGSAVEGLAVEDVAVLENGVARDVVALNLDRRPLNLVLLVDTSAAVERELSASRWSTRSRASWAACPGVEVRAVDHRGPSHEAGGLHGRCLGRLEGAPPGRPPGRQHDARRAGGGVGGSPQESQGGRADGGGGGERGGAGIQQPRPLPGRRGRPEERGPVHGRAHGGGADGLRQPVELRLRPRRPDQEERWPLRDDPLRHGRRFRSPEARAPRFAASTGSPTPPSPR